MGYSLDPISDNCYPGTIINYWKAEKKTGVPRFSFYA